MVVRRGITLGRVGEWGPWSKGLRMYEVRVTLVGLKPTLDAAIAFAQRLVTALAVVRIRGAVEVRDSQGELVLEEVLGLPPD